MSPATQIFDFTPRQLSFDTASNNWAAIWLHGVALRSRYSTPRYSFDGQHAGNELLFPSYYAGNPSQPIPLTGNWGGGTLMFLCDLSVYGAEAQLQMIFEFDAVTQSRVIICSDAEKLDDQTLAVGDNQFGILVEGLELPFNVYFLHAEHSPGGGGGDWFFRRLTGSVI